MKYIERSEIVDLMKDCQGGKSQTDFAAEVGITKQMLNNIYKGIRNPGESVLQYLKSKFGWTDAEHLMVYRVVEKKRGKK